MSTSTTDRLTPTTVAGATSTAHVPPFPADHVGSLLRPPAVREARARAAAGRIGAEELRAVEDEAVREVVRRQGEVGLRVATDGELRRHYWHEDFVFSLGGIEPDQAFSVPFVGQDGQRIDVPLTSARASGRVHLAETVFADHLAFLQRAVAEAGTGATPKLTIPSPNHVHNAFAPLRYEDVYDDEEQLRADVAAAYAEQVRRVHAAGLTYLQVDDVSLTFFGDEQYRGRGEELLGGFIAQFNAALAGRPEGLTVATHLCRGNFRSAWALSGGYDVVADALFNTLDVDGYVLEFDDARSGSLDVLRLLPPGKRVVLGFVTTKTPRLEGRDALLRRIEEAARYAPVEQLALGTQCGFSSTEEGNDLTQEQQWAKLRQVVQVAEEVWG
ncbi:5-methyltetrahydropteroyltriglutamate--homocysteine S-methyltransferase [Quadrisphaera sp. DSM 44207]|uniref:5-methyltetrahydropteroyltriglutamate-- homocysteine S-methyltransferase n=1 Tax=Quadrisphaera sp. DSM 44207 TaxID=1881057 RepID=UPI00088A8A38|nr:5-methyltetrahydropteroyltriglutamate--homocysteine S-methyltransferase [Quadrisphaera sp. DSM 44207]SDQ47336.1 5-methyltetrahydropteroyltriglutamate--homocysteine methyltransferase [Quadrisphaera sp. DSM 44207]